MRLQITFEGRNYDVDVEVLPDGIDAQDDDGGVAIPDSVLLPPIEPGVRAEDRLCRSPIAGAIVTVEVAPGMRLHQGDPVVTIDAMKMETKVGAPIDGIVEEVAVQRGDAVKPGQLLCKLA